MKGPFNFGLFSVIPICMIFALQVVLSDMVKKAEPLFKRPPVILLLGAPFSGKGTQGDRLNKRLDVPLLQSGDLFRKEVASGSALGAKMAKYMNAGELIPDALTIELITDTLTSNLYSSGVIMDGYPRNLDHLRIFEDILNDSDLSIDAIIFLDASKELLYSRFTDRLVCRNCSRSVSRANGQQCCENPDLYRRADDNEEGFKKRLRVYEESTVPLVEMLKSRFPEKFIHIPPEVLEANDADAVEHLINEELVNLPYRRIRPAAGEALNFDDPFEWLLKLVKNPLRSIEKEDLWFYLDWALDCNRPDQTGLWRRVVFVATTSKPKFLEYRKTFRLYGIEVIRLPVFAEDGVGDERRGRMLKMLLTEFESAKFSAIAVLSDESKLYRPSNPPATIETIESGRLQQCSMNNGVHCTNYCVLTVQHVVYASQVKRPESASLKTYKLINHVDGFIRKESKHDSPLVRKFGWDDVFYVKHLNMSYQELREAGYKNSARDRNLSQFLRSHIHYKHERNLNFHAIPVSQSVDFSVDLRGFFEEIREYNLDLVREYGFTNIWRQMLRGGVFLRAAAFRRIGIYWNPGVNGGLPLVQKKDHIHEITYMAHDIGHQILPDLVFTGHNSFLHKRIYIMWRMMSEAFTMALTDMIFIDALKNSGIDYDFSLRKIYPLFKDLKLDVSPRTNPGYLETIRSIVHANFMYCMRGDDSEYRELIRKAGAVEEGPEMFKNLEAFKAKYAPFFVEDYRWTEQNYNSMVSTRSLEAKLWWPAVQKLNDLLGDFRIKSIEDFMGEIDAKAEMTSSTLLDLVFDRAFRDKVVPVISGPQQSFDLKAEPEEARKFRAFVRWMIGQLSVCFKYAFLPESTRLFRAMEAELIGLNGRINDEQILRLRQLYQDYLARLHELSLISGDDMATFSQVYPLFDPFFVNYDKSVEEYEALSDVSARIIDSLTHHFDAYRRDAERLFDRQLSIEEKEHIDSFYLMIERCGGKILEGLFVVEPGVLVLSEAQPASPDSAVSILLAGVSVETSKEFVAHNEIKAARLMSSKTKAMSAPLFEINEYDPQMMKLIKLALKSRLYVETTPTPTPTRSIYCRDKFECSHEGSEPIAHHLKAMQKCENLNMTLPGAKSTVAVLTASLKDWHSILIGRIGSPDKNENAVIKVAMQIAKLLHARHPQFIQAPEFYLKTRNSEKYRRSDVKNFYYSPVETKILPEAWSLFAALNIPLPDSRRPPNAAFITLAEFQARVTFFNFPRAAHKPSFLDSIEFVKNLVVNEDFASILAAYQVVHEGFTMRTKDIFIKFGWDSGFDHLLK